MDNMNPMGVPDGQSTAPVMPPAPPAPAPAAPAPAPAKFEDGGKVNLLQGLTFVDVGMILLSTVALCHVIYYYRKKILEIKKENPAIADLQDDVDELRMNVKAALGAKYKAL